MNRLTSFLLLFLLLPLFIFGQVTVFTDCNYRGFSASLSPGNYYNSTMFSLPDRSISSIRIPPGYRVEMYTGINMTGGVYVVSSNYACMQTSMNNRIRSMRITYHNNTPGNNINPYGGVSVFTECGYRGSYAYLPPGNYNRLKYVIGNDVISSLKVPNGMVIELYQDDDFRGRPSGRITADLVCLGANWNNTASSAKVYYSSGGGWIPPAVKPPLANSGTITVYSGCDYFGQAQKFATGNFADLRTALGNRPAGSIMISSGMTVELYSQPNFRGNLLGKFTTNAPCLQSYIQYGAASMRVYRYGGSGGGGIGGGGGVGGGGVGGGANQGSVTIYSSCNYGGRNARLAPGNYYNINSNGAFSPSSLKVPPGYEITLFTEPNLRGTSSGKITSNLSCLGDWLRGKARSAIVSRVGVMPLPIPRENQ